MVSTRSRAFSWIVFVVLVASCGAAGAPRVSAGENDTPDSTRNDGTPWTFASVYCGTIDANSIWSGTGTFTLTSPAGDTLAGRSTSQAKIPSTGVPYHLDIESGTGSFTGASGPCTVDEHLAPIVFGVQRHSGRFTCTLTTPAGTGSRVGPSGRRPTGPYRRVRGHRRTATSSAALAPRESAASR